MVTSNRYRNKPLCLKTLEGDGMAAVEGALFSFGKLSVPPSLLYYAAGLC